MVNAVVDLPYVILSAGLTMWPMWQMPRASGLRGASGSREKNFSPSVVKSFDITSATKKYKWAVLIAGYKKNCQHVVSTRLAGCEKSLSRVSKGARANNCHGPRLALIRHWVVDAIDGYDTIVKTYNTVS